MITKILVWVQCVLSLLVIVRLVNGLDPWGVILMYWGINALKNVIDGMKDDEDLIRRCAPPSPKGNAVNFEQGHNKS